MRHEGRLKVVFCSAAMVIGAALASAVPALGQDQFYKGKQIRMVVGSGAGGGYDTYGRTLARYLPAHIPGTPSIVVQNMPGATGITATNWGHKVAPKDGLVIVATANAVLLEPLFGNKAAQFEPRELLWIGSIGKQQSICMTWHTNPVKTIEQARDREVVLTATGTTGDSATLPKIINAMLGTKFKVVGGYETTESRLAVERGEADGICGLSWSTIKASNADWIQNKRLNVLLQTGEARQAELPDVPTLIEKVQNPEDKNVLRVLSVPEDFGRPFFMPPGSPAAHVTTIRQAFDATMKDKDFLAEGTKANLEIAPITGAEIQKRISDAYDIPKAAIERMTVMMGRQAKE